MISKFQGMRGAIVAENRVSATAGGAETRISALVKLFSDRKSAADVADVSVAQLHRYMTGESQPSFGAVARMATDRGVRLEWVWTGEGPMREDETKEQRAAYGDSSAAIDWEDLESVMVVLDLILQRLGVNKPNAHWRAAMTRKIYGYYREKVAGRDGLSPKDWLTVMDIIENAIGESDAELNDTGATD